MIAPWQPVVIAATLMLAVSAIVMRILVRPLRREVVISHISLTLETVPAIVVVALSHLPSLFPGAFAKIIGHSIYDYDPSLNGTWLADVWWRSLTIVTLVLFATGFPWAIANMAFGRQFLSNTVAVILFLVWLALAFLGFTGHYSGYL